MLTKENIDLHNKYYKKMNRLEIICKYFKSLGYNLKLIQKNTNPGFLNIIYQFLT